jgi:ABC-type transport system substrate-binding protein
MLIDAGYSYNGDVLKKDGQNVELKLAYLESSELSPVAERYAEALRGLGFAVDVKKFGEAEIMAGQSFYTSVIQPRNYDVLIYEVNLGVSVDPFVYYSSQQANEHGWNLSNYSSRMVDDALLSARTTTDEALRKAKYESFLEYWVNDAPAIGIYRLGLSYYYAEGAHIYAEDVMMTDEFDRFADVRNFASKKGKVNLTP